MNGLWGVMLIIVTGVLCWLAQVISVLSPPTAVKLGVTEPEPDVDPVFFADARGEAVWDALILWTLPVAGILLILNSSWWPYFGLVGGGIYLYFAGRGIVVRREMQRRGIRIGEPENLKVFYAALAAWGLLGAVTMIAAAAALPLP